MSDQPQTQLDTNSNATEATVTPPGTETTPDVAKGVETRSNDADEPNAATEVAPTSPKEKRGSNEAAKWRTKLREAEAQLNEYASRIETLERELVSHYSSLEKVEALWAANVSLDELRNSDGIIDPELVAAADARVREQFGIVERRLPKPDPAQGRGGTFKPKNGFSSAFRL